MGHDKHTNRIWRYRKERHLSQNHVAYLMGHKKASQVSVWESGEDLPTLENALMLGHILDASVEQLYPDLMAEAKQEVDERAAQGPAIHKCPHD